MNDSVINTGLKKTIPWKLVLIFLLFSAAIVLVGIYYFESQKNKIFTEQENNLSAIAGMKINQILSWRNERIEDATVISNDKPLIRSIEIFFNGGNKDSKSELSDWMKSVRNEYDYLNVLIADTSYKVRLSVNSSDYFLGDSIKEEMKKALKGHSIVLTDLHRSKEIPLIHLDILIPLIDSVNKKQITVGLAMLRIDPYKVLFPLVQSWPTSSKSSETLLLRKERDSVIYLNELRHLKNTALRLKMPLTNKALLATKAVYGLEGLTEGTDYRNIPVVGSVHKIPETSWYMVAKVDKEEILSPLKRYVFQIILIVVLLVLINASIFGFWIWEQRLRMYRLQLKDEMAIHESEEMFTTAFMMSPVSVTISSLTDNRFIDVNNTFLKDMEYMREEVMGRTPRELNIWADENERLWIINEIKEKGRIFGKIISYRSKTGKIIYGLSSMSVVKVNGEPCNLSTVVNITESKNAELKLIESEELFRKLFENMLNGFAYCKMICEDGKPFDFIYLNVNKAFATLTGLKDVMGKKVSEAIPGIQEADPELLERCRRVSLTGIPEMFETYLESLKMWFAISVYCPQKGYFVAVFDVITARKIAEEKLQETNEYLSNLFNYANAPIITWDTSLLITRFNHAFEELSGYSAEEVIGRKISILFPKDETKSSLSLINEAVKGEHWETVEIEIKRKDGDSRMVLWNSANIHDKDGKTVIATIAQGYDITERQKIEQTLIESEVKFRKAFFTNPDPVTITHLDNGTYVSVNDGFTKTFEYSEEEVIGKTPFDISIWHNVDERKLFINALKAEGEVRNFETKFYTKSRRLIDCLITATTISLEGVDHVLSNTRDITYRKNAELALLDSEERFRSLYENATMGIYRTTLDGKILMANPALVKMLGFSSFEDLAHRNLQEEGYEPDYPRAKFLETLEKEDKIIGLESAWHQRNGNTLYVRESASIIRDAAGKILYYDGNVEDITYRKQAEEALRESERRLREAQEMAHLGFWLWDIKTGDVEWSDEVFKIFCLDPATFKPRINSILDMSPWPEDHERDKELIRRAIESHDPGTYEQRFLRPDKSVGFYYSTFRGNYDNNGNLFSIVGTILDITERKKAEEILQESEARFRRLIESAPLPLCYVDKDGMITLRNERFIKIFGYNETDVPDLRQWWQKAYRDPEYRKWVVENWNEAVIQASKNGTDIQSKEYEVTCKDGSVRTIIISGITIGEDLLATFIDITERKKAEDAIRESEDKFKYIFEHSALGNSITHPNGETHFNNAFCEMLGYSEEELVKMKWQDFTHPDDFEITQKVFDILVSRESDSPRFIKRYLRKDGSVMWADVSTSLRYDKDNKPLYFMTTVNDITDLKLAEEVLRNDEKRFRELIEALPQLYWTCRVDGPCDYLSRQWVKYTGIPESDQLGYGWLEQLHPEDREKTITAWAEKVKNGTSFDIEFRIRRYDGEYHWFKTRAVPIHDSEGRLIRWLGSNTDIDSIRKAEDQLRNYSKDLEQRVILRTEQLEAANKELEAFSYSVSHDLRAPLRSVHGFTKILLEDYEANLDEEGKRICGIISSSATQMGELIDDLLSFSRIGRSSLNPSEIDMKKMAKVVFEGMTSPSERKRIKLKIGKLSSAFGDITLFGQVWTNLISNAIKYSSKIDVSEINIGSESDGKMITYFVKDNGVGFDMNYKHKLFSVFQRLHSEAEFEGNGVGLAIVQRIILKHGGKVWAEGEVGKGATFYFSLPEGDGQQATGDRKTKGSMPDARHPMPDANT